MTPLTLNLTADDPADIADLVNQALDHDHGTHAVAVDTDGGITIAVTISRTRRPLIEACQHPADLPDPVHCQMLAGHAGPHRAHGLVFDDDGQPVAVPDGPLLDETTDPHETDSAAPAAAEAEPDEDDVDDDAPGDEPAGRPVTIRDQVQQLIDANPTRTFTLAQVFEHIDDTTEGSIGQILKKLTAAGRIRRVARGQYQAIDRTTIHDRRRQAAAAGMFGS